MSGFDSKISALNAQVDAAAASVQSAPAELPVDAKAAFDAAVAAQEQSVQEYADAVSNQTTATQGTPAPAHSELLYQMAGATSNMGSELDGLKNDFQQFMSRESPLRPEDMKMEIQNFTDEAMATFQDFYDTATSGSGSSAVGDALQTFKTFVDEGLEMNGDLDLFNFQNTMGGIQGDIAMLGDSPSEGDKMEIVARLDGLRSETDDRIQASAGWQFGQSIDGSGPLTNDQIDDLQMLGAQANDLIYSLMPDMV